MAVTYEVQSGENLESIARRFGTTTAEILRVNEIPDPQRLQVRTVIRIPVPVIPPTIPSRRPFRNVTTSIIRNILYIFSTDRMLYRRNQRVQLQLIKINIGPRPITLTYNTAQRFDFYVRRGIAGPVIWQWSQDRQFAQFIQRVTLAPGAAQIFNAVWDQRTNEGIPVQPGLYTVQAENVAQELRGRRVSLRIRIAP
ncbi:MAG TPA: LysM peptidoglycan-binding domain-containing protein [Clostridia bacterium]|nr:LysM peptidoglycan-binding domain-containing protein [Clostridia bacterium]